MDNPLSVVIVSPPLWPFDASVRSPAVVSKNSASASVKLQRAVNAAGRLIVAPCPQLVSASWKAPITRSPPVCNDIDGAVISVPSPIAADPLGDPGSIGVVVLTPE